MAEIDSVTKKRIHDLEGNICRVCRNERSTNIDHILPKALGGSNRRLNLQPICYSCHAAKTAIDLDNIDRIKREILSRNVWGTRGGQLPCAYSDLSTHELCIYLYLLAHGLNVTYISPCQLAATLFTDRAAQGVNKDLATLEWFGVLKPVTVHARRFSDISYATHRDLYHEIMPELYR